MTHVFSMIYNLLFTTEILTRLRCFCRDRWFFHSSVFNLFGLCESAAILGIIHHLWYLLHFKVLHTDIFLPCYCTLWSVLVGHLMRIKDVTAHPISYERINRKHVFLFRAKGVMLFNFITCYKIMWCLYSNKQQMTNF